MSFVPKLAAKINHENSTILGIRNPRRQTALENAELKIFKGFWHKFKKNLRAVSVD